MPRSPGALDLQPLHGGVGWWGSSERLHVLVPASLVLSGKKKKPAKKEASINHETVHLAQTLIFLEI